MNTTPKSSQDSESIEVESQLNDNFDCEEGSHHPLTLLTEKGLRRRVTVAVTAMFFLTSAISYSVGSRVNLQTPQMELKQISGIGNSSGAAAEMSSDARMGYFYSGRVVLTTLDTLKGSAGIAPAWSFTAEGVDRRAFLTNLADAIGLSGQIREESWQLGVGSLDGTGANAWVGTDSYGYFGAYDPARSPWSCADITTKPISQPASEAEIVEPFSAPISTCNPVAGSAPSDEASRRVAREFLEKVGVNVSNSVVNVTTTDASTTVFYSSTLQGYQLPWSISVDIGAAGIFSVNGLLAIARPLPAYPIVDAVTAAKRSLDPRWSSLGPVQVWDGTQIGREGIMPATYVDDTSAIGAPRRMSDISPTTSPSTGLPETTTTVVLRNGRPALEAPLTNIVVKSAEVSLGQFSLPDGSSVLLPVWEYRGADGSLWAMIAVEENYVIFTTNP